MTLVPAFEIGVWNAWILLLPVMLAIPFYFLIGKKRGPSPSRESNASKIEKTISFSLSSLDFLAMIYSVFLPLKLWTPWFYVGLPVALLGIIGIITGLLNWATTPPDAPVTRGLHRYTRHPFYVAEVLLLLGVGIATASWLFLLYSIVYVVGISAYVHTEEKGCLEKYGDAYCDYANRTPRWIGIPKSRD
jgi:protein-S-isoprenylcysteine O-methyltransferase Ste14